MKRLAGLVAVALSIGCGSSNNSGGSVGSVGGNALTINDAIFAIDDHNVLYVAASDRSGLCTLLSGGTAPTGKTTALLVGLFNLGATGTSIPLVTGDYSVINSLPSTAGKYGFGAFVVANGCTISSEPSATSGTFTVQQLGTNSSGQHTTGHFDLNFSSDKLSGNVDATYCEAFLTTTSDVPGCT
jgi:hypothetical protein